MPVLMLMLITLLNDGTLITIGYDRAEPTQTPPKWNLAFLFSMAYVQAFVAMISSLLLLWTLLDSWNSKGIFQAFGFTQGVSYSKITSSIYLKVSVSDFLTLFSARAGGDWFWKVRPANILLGGAMFALSSSTAIAMAWPNSKPDKIPTEGLLLGSDKELAAFVWGWSLFWWFAEDAAKVACRYIVHKFNIFGVNNTGVMILTESAKAEKIKMENAKIQAGH
jgi:H+-transporting ATPase